MNNSQKTGTTSLSSLLYELYIIPNNIGIYSHNDSGLEQELVPLLRELIKPRRWKMLQHYFKHGASTIWILRYTLNQSRSRVYEEHGLLTELGIVVPKTKIKPVGKMKRPATVWGLPEATEDQIRNAYQLHLKLINPYYRQALKLSQRYLDEYGTRQPSNRELIDLLKDWNIQPALRYDTAIMINGIILENSRGGSS